MRSALILILATSGVLGFSEVSNRINFATKPPVTLNAKGRNFPSPHHVLKSPRGRTINLLISRENEDEQIKEAITTTSAIKSYRRTLSLSAIAIMLFCGLGVFKRQELLGLASSLKLESIQQWLRNILEHLNEAGPMGLFVYTLALCIWTMTVGITTPVETAAGFAFGSCKAVVANAIGKIGGACMAFLLGRFIFYDKVHDTLKQNEILQLVEESITETPLRVALLTRLSPLPEIVKNLGMAVLKIRTRFVLLATIFHGLPFSILWSSLGAETAKVVAHGAPPSATLKIVVSATTWFGFVVSPTLIGWWLKGLREKRSLRHSQTNNGISGKTLLGTTEAGDPLEDDVIPSTQ